MCSPNFILQDLLSAVCLTILGYATGSLVRSVWAALSISRVLLGRARLTPKAKPRTRATTMFTDVFSFLFHHVLQRLPLPTLRRSAGRARRVQPAPGAAGNRWSACSRHVPHR